MRATAASAVVVLLTLVGCSSEPEPEPTPEPSAGPLESLFQEYLAEWSNEDVTRQLTRMEEAIAACMAEQGFSYTPVDYSAVDVDFLGTDLGVDPGTLEFAERYGYGLTTDPWGVGDLDPDALEDPNAEYVAAMSKAEQEAYRTALYGTYGEPDASGQMPDDEALADYSWRDAGCTGLAQQQVLTGGGAVEDEQFLGLQQEMATMMQSASRDPRLDRAAADWAVCMAEAGYPGLSAVGDAEAEISAEVDAVWATATAEAAQAPGLTDQVPIGELVAEQLRQISSREIETAVADLTCQEEVGHESLRRQIDAEYQREFLAENSEEITAWLASLQSLRDVE